MIQVTNHGNRHRLRAGGGAVLGTSPVLVKRGLRHSNISAAVLLQSVGSVLVLVLIIPFGEVELLMPWTAAGVFVSVGLVGSFLGRTFALKGIDEVGASRAQSIVNSAPLLTAVYAVILLGETATPLILIGVVLIVSGLLVITRGSPDDDDRRPFRLKGFLNPLLAIVFFGFGPILKKVAILAGGTPVPGSLITHVTGLALIMFFGRVCCASTGAKASGSPGIATSSFSCPVSSREWGRSSPIWRWPMPQPSSSHPSGTCSR